MSLLDVTEKIDTHLKTIFMYVCVLTPFLKRHLKIILDLIFFVEVPLTPGHALSMGDKSYWRTSTTVDQPASPAFYKGMSYSPRFNMTCSWSKFT